MDSNSHETSKVKSPLRVLFAGGGSGGHVYPLLAVVEGLIEEARTKQLPLELHYLGPDDDYAKLLRAAGVNCHSLWSAKLRGYTSSKNILDIPKFFVSLFQSFFKVFLLMPDVLFSKGGTSSVPVVIASWFYRVPILIHESDSVPGLSNAISGRFAKRVALSLEQSKVYFSPKKVAIVGTPVRPSLLQDPLTQKDAKEALGFNPQEFLLLVLGGSQGAKALNEFIVTNLDRLTALTETLHQTGTIHFLDIEKLSRAALISLSLNPPPKSYRPMAYLTGEDMKKALRAADVVVSRAGSNSIFEIAAFGKPAILVPLPIPAAHQDHQRLNAYAFAETGAAVVIEQDNLLPDIFFQELKTILENNELRKKMGEASRAFYKPEATKLLAQELLALAGV